jgi:hypothetical protein
MPNSLTSHYAVTHPAFEPLASAPLRQRAKRNANNFAFFVCYAGLATYV